MGRCDGSHEGLLEDIHGRGIFQLTVTVHGKLQLHIDIVEPKIAAQDGRVVVVSIAKDVSVAPLHANSNSPQLVGMAGHVCFDDMLRIEVVELTRRHLETTVKENGEGEGGIEGEVHGNSAPTSSFLVVAVRGKHSNATPNADCGLQFACFACFMSRVVNCALTSPGSS